MDFASDRTKVGLSSRIMNAGRPPLRIAIMYRGRICEMGTRDEIVDRPSHPYTRTLLASLVNITADPPTALEMPPAGTPPCSASIGGAPVRADSGLIWLSDTHWMRPERVADAENDVSKATPP